MHALLVFILGMAETIAQPVQELRATSENMVMCIFFVWMFVTSCH